MPAPKSWKDLADPKYAGARGSYIIPVNSLGQMHLMMLGKLYGKGLTDLDAAYKALEQLKPIKMYDFTGGMEKALLSAEVNIGVLHDSGIYRYDGQNQPIAFAAPSEGVLSLEQVWTVTPGSKVKELAYAVRQLHPAARTSRSRSAKRCGIRPPNKKVKLDAEIRRQALQHRGEGRAADPGRLEMVQRAQGRHRRARDAHPARVTDRSFQLAMSDSRRARAADVRLERVEKSFDGRTRVVDRVDLTVEPGEFFALLGPSGCGKTTTLRMIAGFEEPDDGRIMVGGEDVTHMPVHRRDMGMIFQSYALFPHRTVAENVAFGLRMRGLGKGEISERVTARRCARSRSKATRIAARRSSPAASSSASRSRARSSSGRACCCATSRSPRSTASCARACSSSSSSCSSSSASR